MSKTQSKPIELHIRLSPTLFARLQALAKTKECSMSQLIRDLLIKDLKSHP